MNANDKKESTVPLIKRGGKPRAVLVLMSIVLLFVSSNINWGKNRWKSIIESDAKGYYAYLPAVFIYHDLNFGFFDFIEKEKYYDKNLYYDYRSSAEGKTIDKYYCGVAVAQMPFFLIAHGSTLLIGGEADGYSKLYPILINLAAIIYLMLGLWYMNKWLRLYEVNEFIRAWILIVAVFGTNLYYYAVIDSGMSHVYSFSFVSMFLYYAKKYYLSLRPKYIVYALVILGMITIIRPINAMLVLFLSFISGSSVGFLKGIKTAFLNAKFLLVGVTLLFFVVFIQLFIYKISTGTFWVYSYGQEGFNFLEPQMIDFLFSYRKGLFLYTPVYFISLAGLIYLWQKSRFEFWTMFLFLLFITYIFSSWWMWYFGGGFSARVLVEYIPLFMLSMALAIQHYKTTWIKRGYYCISVLLIIVCQLQTWQYRYYEIHWSDMTREKYWEVFLRLNKLF